MALSLRNHDASREPEGGRWIPIGDAASKMGVNEGNLRRKCQKLQHEGTARKIGGAWHIHESHHPRLNDRANLPTSDLEHLAELDAKGIAPKYIEIARRRRDILHGFKAAQVKYANHPARRQRELYLATLRAEGATDAPSVTQFYEWEKAYAEDGLRNLVPQFAYKTTDAGGGAVGEEALNYIDRLINSPKKVTLAAAIAIAEGEAAKAAHASDPRWRIGSYSAVRLALKPRQSKLLRRLVDKGEKAARADFIPKIMRDYESIGAGDEYVGDERTLDIWCRVFQDRKWKAIRPKLTAWTDMRSRVVVGWVLHAHADSNTILASLKRAIRDYGKPLVIRTDWGEDYKKAARRPNYTNFDGSRIGSILDELGIEVSRTSGPYMPYVKPIESFFKTMKIQFDGLHDSFWGGCPSERHEDRAKYLRDNLDKLKTIEECAGVLAGYFDLFNNTPHGAPDLFGKTPLQAMAAFRTRPVARESDAVLGHLFKRYVGPQMVRRDGIKHMGRFYGNGDARLLPLTGEKVLLAFDVDDASRATVCKLDRTPMFSIECLAVRGRSERDLKEDIRRRRRMLLPLKQQVREYAKWSESVTPAELLENRRRGIEAKHGDLTPAADAEPAALRIRPALEGAIDDAEPAPSDAIDLESMAVRTGTDDREINLVDMVFDEPDVAHADDEGDDDTDFFGVNDLEDLP